MKRKVLEKEQESFSGERNYVKKETCCILKLIVLGSNVVFNL